MIVRAIKRLRPGASFGTLGDDYEGVQWLDEIQTLPTREEVEAEILLILAEQAATQYQRDRAPAYPSISDQLDMLWHMMDDETIPGKGSDWYNAIKAVKEQFPKP